MIPSFAYNPIADALKCVTVDATGNQPKTHYGRGIIVGLFSGLMANRMVTFEEVMAKVVREGKDNDVKINYKCIPPGEEWEPLYDLCEPRFVEYD